MNEGWTRTSSPQLLPDEPSRSVDDQTGVERNPRCEGWSQPLVRLGLATLTCPLPRRVLGPARRAAEMFRRCVSTGWEPAGGRV